MFLLYTTQYIRNLAIKYTKMYIYIYIYIYTHTHTLIYIYIYTHTHTHTDIYIYIYIYIYTYTHTHTDIYIYIYIYIYIPSSHVANQDFPDSLSLSIHPYHPLLSAGPPDYILCPHSCWRWILVCCPALAHP